jgi:hypothetical protein
VFAKWNAAHMDLRLTCCISYHRSNGRRLASGHSANPNPERIDVGTAFPTVAWLNPKISGHCRATKLLVIVHIGDVSSACLRAKAIRQGGFTKRRFRWRAPRSAFSRHELSIPSRQAASSDERPVSISTDTIGFG